MRRRNARKAPTLPDRCIGRENVPSTPETDSSGGRSRALNPGLDAVGQDQSGTFPIRFGDRRLDTGLGHLCPGEMVCLEGNTGFVFDVLYMLMVNTLREPNARIVYVDGCNVMDPYKVVGMCKSTGIPPAGGPDAEAYKKRSDTLKWLLVTAFGYTGYRNARFGRIECHESITAYGREILLDAKEIAERHGYEILHGIVDSLWLKGDPEKAGVVAEEISRGIGIPLEVEGRYKWIVFLPNKGNGVGALNRYYGAFEDGEIKARGIELRRRDTPAFIRDFQKEVLELFGGADTAQELTALIDPALDMAKKAAKRLMQREVDPRCLLFSKTISKPLDDYKVISDQVSCLYQMRIEGMKVAPGQSVRFVITDSRSRDPRTRVRPEMHVDENTRYDAKAYIRHLARALESLLLPFGWTEKDIFDRII